MTIEELRDTILPVDEESMEAARRRWLSVAKPLFSLGKLEEQVIRMAGIRRSSEPELGKKGLLIFCADNGVVAEGVTQTGQDVTAIVADNFTKNEACTSIMAQVAGVDVFPVDIGMISDVLSVSRPEWKVAYGTKNFAEEPAMTLEEVQRAMEVGICLVREKKEQGYGILATGEMGIGNTTTSSAVAAALLGKSAREVTGRGAGLSSQGLEHKIEVIETALKRYRLTKAALEQRIEVEKEPESHVVTDILSKIGGLDIAGLTGVFLGGAIYHVPIVIDGFISAVAALCAVRLVPQVQGYLIPSHVSQEPAAQMILKELGLSALLDCNMCLGEGSGAVAVLPVLEMALEVYRQMSTFEEIKVDQYEILQ